MAIKMQEELGEGAEVTSKEIKEVAQKINNKLEALAEDSEKKAKTAKKKLEKAKKVLEKELLPRKEKYDRLTPDRLNSAVWS